MRIKYYEIQKNIPLPSHRLIGKYGGLSLSSFIKSMKKGDSLLVPSRQKSSIYITGLRLGVKFVTRTITPKTARMWRKN